MQTVTDLEINSRSGAEIPDYLDQTPKRKVRYMYVISTIFVTYRKHSRVFELGATDGWFKRFSIGLPYSVISLLLGWWGFPFGLLYTPWAIIKNTLGGEDVTFKLDKQSPHTEKLVNNRLQK